MSKKPEDINIPVIALDEGNKPVFITLRDIIHGKKFVLDNGDEIIQTVNGRYSLGLNLDQTHELLRELTSVIKINDSVIVMTDKIKTYNQTTKELYLDRDESMKVENEYVEEVEKVIYNLGINVIK